MSWHGRIASPVILLICIPLFLTQLANAQTSSANDRLTLWYTEPARVCMNEALPVGNGRLGGMVFGTPGAERIVVNEDSMWTGDEDPSGDYNRMGGVPGSG
jgi:alpha-L-fucosidase 2